MKHLFVCLFVPHILRGRELVWFPRLERGRKEDRPPLEGCGEKVRWVTLRSSSGPVDQMVTGLDVSTGKDLTFNFCLHLCQQWCGLLLVQLSRLNKGHCVCVPLAIVGSCSLFILIAVQERFTNILVFRTPLQLKIIKWALHLCQIRKLGTRPQMPQLVPKCSPSTAHDRFLWPFK